jgi:hypothetical protein
VRRSPNQQAQSSNQGEVRLSQTKYLHQMIWCDEEKGFHENVSPQFNPMLQEYQQQIAINVMKITNVEPHKI